MKPALLGGDSEARLGDEPNPASILAGAQAADVATDPFWHLIAPAALPIDRYRDLAASFPTSETILGGRVPRKGNAAARLPAIKVLDNPSIAPEWRSFFDFHTSDRFWADIL